MSEKFDVEATDYGMRLAVKGFVSPEDVAEMNQRVEQIVSAQKGSFGVLVDMRANRAFSNEVAELMKQQIEVSKHHGMKRGAIVLQSAIMTLQARRITTETGIGPEVRFIDASADDDWEKSAVAWVARGQEPPVPAAKE